MSQDRAPLPEVAWQEFLPTSKLLSTPRLALNARSMLLAAVAIVLTVIGFWVLARAFSQGEPDAALLPPPSWIQPWHVTAGAANLPTTSSTLDWPLVNPLVRAWGDISRPLVEMFLNRQITLARFTYLLLCGLWTLVVWSFFGGAITRWAAVKLARDEQLPLSATIAYARSKWGAYLTAPLFPLLGVLLATIPVAVLGLLLRLGGVGVILAGLIWPLFLLAGVFMAILLVGLFFGFPLMWATISAEGTDSFDALSRSYSYTYQRPLRYLVYVAIAAVLGALAWIAVGIFAEAIIALSQWAVSWGAGTAQLQRILSFPDDLSGMEWVGATLIWFWIWCVLVGASAFAYSYFWTASTAIYFLLRRSVDATEMDEVYLPEAEQAFGLPPLHGGPDGAEVSEQPVPQRASDIEA